MKRRLSLAIALLGQPQLLILDEPTVGIDPALRLEIWRELDQMKKDGCGVLVTTHVTIGTANVSSTLVKQIDGVKHVSVKTYASADQANQVLKDYRIDATVVKTSANHYHLTFANIDSAKTALTKQAFQVALQKSKAHQLAATI
ncbi:AAA family ATPase [Limosilactobacillus fermentum]|nr:AAA family ATPase [Limosilactobacillus fermentum]